MWGPRPTQRDNDTDDETKDHDNRYLAGIRAGRNQRDGNRRHRQRQQRPGRQEAIQITEFSDGIFDTWIDYVYSERTQVGLYEELANNETGCYCGKGRMTFPHWPPTTMNEATEQLRNCLTKENTHRRYLTFCWWSFLRRMAIVEEQTTDNDRERYLRTANYLEKNCPIIREELDKDLRHPERPKGWKCDDYCEMVLNKEYDFCSCLCHCRHHRDECPIHSNQ